MYVYVVRKLTSTFSASSSSYYGFYYLRYKHHLVNGFKLYTLGQPWTRVYTCTASSSEVAGYAQNVFGKIGTTAIDVQERYNGEWSWQFASMDTKTAHDIGLLTSDDSSMVINVRMNWGRSWSELSTTTTHCNIESGVIGNDPLNPIYCYLDSVKGQMVIYNVYSLSNLYLKFYYYARTSSSQNDYDLELQVYANVDAFNDGNWPIYKSSSNTNIDLTNMFYAARSFTGL